MVKRSRVWTRAQVQSCWKQQCHRILETSNPGRRDRLVSSGDFRFVVENKIFSPYCLQAARNWCNGFPKTNEVQKIWNNRERKTEWKLNAYKHNFPGEFLLLLLFWIPVWASAWIWTGLPICSWRTDELLKKAKASLKTTGIENVQRRMSRSYQILGQFEKHRVNPCRLAFVHRLACSLCGTFHNWEGWS